MTSETWPVQFLAQLPAQVAGHALAQPSVRLFTPPPIQRSPSSAPPVQQIMSIQSVKDCFETTNSKQRDKPVKTISVPQKVACLETVTLSMASPETEFQLLADSGHLEAKKPSEDCTLLSLPEQSKSPAQLQPALCLPEVSEPAGSVLILPEVPAPASLHSSWKV